MIKVGLVTICDYKNYGNRLQNYATQQVLRGLGCEPETIVNMPPRPTPPPTPGLIVRLRNTIGTDPQTLLEGIRHKVSRRRCKKRRSGASAAKQQALKAFTHSHIKETDYAVTPDSIQDNLSEMYDYFVVGSDQIWNPTFRRGFSFDFLQFAPKEKRVAYAPSFGVSVIPDEYIERYREWISDMAHLSVREEAGAALIRQLSGREAAVLADPTLMLSESDWLSVSRPASYSPQRDYLLTYFLGDLSAEKAKMIERIAATKGLESVHLGSITDPDRFAAGPDEFIDYLLGASLVLTDSFHGTIFSILFNVPFVVFSREGRRPVMNSRLDTVLHTFQFTGRKYENMRGTQNIFDLDFSHVPAILAFERMKALSYLRTSLGIAN